uniref:Uncharacterized protein n=1 Tax=Rhipicephalus zambeziensis TaxID=60191 RepID=A0A224YRG7_9ACAR
MTWSTRTEIGRTCAPQTCKFFAMVGVSSYSRPRSGSLIWMDCALPGSFEGTKLLHGDSRYSCKSWMLSLLSVAGLAEQQYSAAATRAREVIERTFGVLGRTLPIRPAWY